ncbi:MAG: hypothetical protein R3290_08895 [Acidimicrobiia bacterium]|nr:hypothetical protein [Acidimicrobiia bacterium]
MTYPSIRRRRQRRRRTIVVLAFVAVGVFAAYAITRVQSEEVQRREYLDVAADVVSAEDSAATRFTSLIVGLEDLRRTTMVTTLEDLETEVSDLAEQLTTVDEPDGELLKAHFFLEIAATRWRSGMANTRQGMLRLSESSLDDVGIALVTQGLTDLRVGDSAYAGFLGEITGVDTSLQGGPFPRVRFIPEEDAELFQAEEVARRLFLTPGLGTTTNVAVNDISLTPAPLGEEDGLPVVPTGMGLDVAIAISNEGNTDVDGVPVRLVLVSSGGDRFENERLVGELRPGEATSLTFEDLPVGPGTIYEITARIEGVDDDPLDDIATFTFLMDEES